jgi:hypothetical protein
VSSPGISSTWFAGCVGGSPGTNYQPCISPIQITEINYSGRSDFNTGDWLELKNTTNASIDLNQWAVATTTGTYQFNQSLIIPANGYLVVCQDTALFSPLWPAVTNRTGNSALDFGTTDKVRVKNADGNVVTYLEYTNTSPWPTQADGTGKTLEYFDTASTPFAADRWFAGCFGGTPGAPYALPCLLNGVNDIQNGYINVFPNPTNGIFVIETNKQFNKNESLEIYNSLGEKVYTDQWAQTLSQKRVNLSNLANGVYMIKLMADNQVMQYKIIKQ